MVYNLRNLFKYGYLGKFVTSVLTLNFPAQFFLFKNSKNNVLVSVCLHWATSNALTKFNSLLFSSLSQQPFVFKYLSIKLIIKFP